MNDEAKTSAQSIDELSKLRSRVAELESDLSEASTDKDAMRERDTQFRRVVENISDVIFEIDHQGVVLYFSPIGKNIWGYDQEDVIGKNFIELVHPDDLDLLTQRFLELSAGVEYPLTYRLRDKSGNFRWVRTSTKPKMENGRFIGAMGTLIDVTDQKRIEESLRESEEKYRKLFENAKEAIFVVQDAKLVFLNPMTTVITGYSGEELISRPFIEFIHLDDRDMVMDSYIRRMKGEELPHTYAFRIIDKGGNSKWVELNAVLINWMGKTASLNFLSDIDERKQAEEALRESEEKYRTILESIDDGYCEQDLAGNFIFLNDSMCRIYGYPKEELMGMNYKQHTDEESGEKCLQVYRYIYRTEEAGKVVDFEIIRKDGTRRHIESSVSLKKDSAGKPIAFRGIVRDITDRKQVEDALQKSEEKYRTILENIQEGYFELDLAGNFTFVNDAECRNIGYPREELIGMNNRQFQDETVAQEMYHRFRRLYRAGEPVTALDVEIIRKNGTKGFNEVSAYLVRDTEGKPIGFRGVSRDITERKQAEEEKRRLEERLQHADKMEAIGTLAGGIAHDFNNLLMGIQGYTSMILLNLNPNNPNCESLKRIEDQVQSGAELTRQLLGFARGGRYEVKPIDMNNIIEQSSSMFARTKKEITIHKKYENDLRPVEVDLGQMEQVFMNLYLNAWQAMPEGGEIYLKTENVLLNDEKALPYSVKAGRYVKISITDTGIGMDEKTKERIFEPFFTTKAMGRGTGLGLATVYGIIKGHKGMINVYSELGHGTIFNIYLPASEKEVVKEKTATGTIARGMETILLVDDEKVVLEVNKELLESMGYRVYAVGSGQEATSLYIGKRNEIDLVILDLIMPGISGGETFDRLREINPGVRVLLSSGYSLTGEAQTIMDRGCNGFLQKPFQIEKFSQKVREMLD